MKKQKKYGAYLFAAMYSMYAMIANKYFSKPGFIFPLITYIVILIGLWNLTEKLLYFNHKLLRWVYLLVGLNMYIFVIIALDFYVFHLLMNFTKVSVIDLYVVLISVSVGPIILLESMRWMREREKAQVENLTLQAENIEANFQLLKEQVNPDFLFYCLHHLQTMAKADDPNMEDYILKLADVYRQFLQKDKNSHLLRKELVLFQSYMFLMCYGREAALSVEVKVQEEALERKIPIFALQLVAYNYIKHHDFSQKQPLHLSVFQKEAESITITHNQAHTLISDGIDTEQLEMCYAFEGIENGIRIEKETDVYSTTLSLL